jgi:hypothetical protein
MIANRLLDMEPDVGQVFYTCRFDLLDRSLERIGSLSPATGAAQVSMSTRSSIMRTLRNFELTATEAADVDVYAHRVKAWMVIQDGTEWPLGVFLFSDPQRPVGSWHTPLVATLLDQNLLLQQESTESFGVRSRARIEPAIAQVLTMANVNQYTVVQTDARVLDPIIWPAGTPYLRILSELAKLAGFYRPYFNSSGVCTFRSAEEPTDGPDVHDYRLDREGGSRVVAGSPLESPSVDTPGAHRVVNNGITGEEIVATAFVDPELPWSRERRGYLVQRTHRVQGVETSAAARQMARALVLEAPQAQVRFSGPPDPRHDTFDTVKYGPGAGELYIEHAWSLPLSGGAPMTHEVTRGGVTTDEGGN